MAIEATEFRKLLETHQRMVFSLALRIAGDYGAAEEVAQDVFLQLFHAADALKSEDHIRFWLRRVTVHRAADALRRRSRQPEIAAEEWIEGQRDFDLAGGAPAQMGVGVAARVEELLRALPEPMRVAVVLHYQEEMPPEQIAALLGQPLATVKSHLQRGLRLLRRKAAVTMKEYAR